MFATMAAIRRKRMPDLGNGKKKAVLFPCVRRYSADCIHQEPDSQRVSPTKVMAQTGEDVTKEYTLGAKEALRLAKENNVAFCIMKLDSPSCGSKYIYDGTFTDTKVPGQGLASGILEKRRISSFQ